MQVYTNTVHRIAELERENARLAAAVSERDVIIERRSHDPCWNIPNHFAIHDMLAQLDPDQRVIAYQGDVTNLKQLNSAFGSQPPLDACMARVFSRLDIRSDDIFGRGDAGDQLYLVCPVHTDGRRRTTDGNAVIRGIAEALRDTPMRAETRAAYVRGACAKKYGKWMGRLFEALHYAGWAPIADYITIDWQAVPPCTAGELKARMAATERALFVQKATHA